MALTKKQERFAEEFLVDFNATQAAIRAGYAPKSARVTASKLLTKANLSKLISERSKQVCNRLEVTQERTVEELRRIAFSDVRNFFNSDNTMKNVRDLDEETAAALASVEQVEIGENGVIKKLKLNDKLKALNLLAKYLGMFTPEVEAQDNEPQVVVYWPNNGKDLSNPLPEDIVEGSPRKVEG
jgi:phage terminase small subunit